MQPLRRILRLIHLLNVSRRKRLVMMSLFFYVVVILLIMYAVLDFESKNLIAKNKKPCLSCVVDFDKLSQVIVYFLFSPLFVMMFELDKLYFDTLIFQSSCSSASPSFASEDIICLEVDHVLDKVVEDLISDATTIVALESD